MNISGSAYKILFLLTAVMVIFALSVHFRMQQYEGWKKLPHKDVQTEYLSVMTGDGHYWSRVAKEYEDGVEHPDGLDHMRFYPDGEKALKPPPLLSVLIAECASVFNVSHETAGIYMSPILASLFIIPLFLYFCLLGLPSAGILGGFVGTFSYYYYLRTSFGYIDTDLLNLFFMVLISLFILLASSSDDRKKVLLFSALAGFAQYMFCWWYFKPGFTVVFFAVYLLTFFVAKKNDLKAVGYGALAFIICADPLYLIDGFVDLYDFIMKYLTGEAVVKAAFPNALQTVSEFQKLDFMLVIKGIFSAPALGISGLLLFAVCLIGYWRKLIPLFPLAALAMLSFVSSVRFSYYLAPLAGIGFGFGIHSFVHRFFKGRIREIFLPYVTVGASLLFCLIIINQTAYNKMKIAGPRPEVVESYKDLREILPENAAVYSWWDNGYIIENITGKPTYHDGGIQMSANTFFIAKSFVSESQSELHSAVKYLEDNGYKALKKQIKEGKNTENIIETVLEYKSDKPSETYVLFTNDMVMKYPAFSVLGGWDFDKNEGKARGYNTMKCSKMELGSLHCDKGVFDLSAGTLNGRIPIKRYLFVDRGHVVRDRTFNHSKGIYLEVEFIDKKFAGAVYMDEPVFKSNFNQMFLLGAYDPDKFRLVLNRAPFIKVFKVIN